MNATENKMDAIVIGELNVDIILNEIESFPAIGKEIIAHSMSVTLGSSSAIFASNLSSLGTAVGFIGKVGDDNFARVVLTSLERKKVDTSHITKTSLTSTGATIVLNYDQDRANVTYPGAMNEFCLKDIDFEFLANFRHMHFSSCFLQPGIRKDLPILFRKAKELGLTTSLDPQWDPEEKWDLPLEEILPFVDVFLPNRQEFQFITRSNSVEEGIRNIEHAAKTIVIKNGIEGSVAWHDDNIFIQPAFANTMVVDCIGAGDSFNAGFIHDFIQKKPLTKCLVSGSLAGAINTTRAGGTGAFENIEMIREIAHEKFNYTF